MPRERLSDLALLSIKNERARMINVAKMFDVFAEQKARKNLSQDILSSTVGGVHEDHDNHFWLYCKSALGPYETLAPGPMQS